MTFLIATIIEPSAELAIQAVVQAFANGADLVELRLDALTEPVAALKVLLQHLPPGRWIATSRSRSEGGHADGPAEEVATLLAKAARGGAGWIDIERRLLAAHPPLAETLAADSESASWIVSQHFPDGGWPGDNQAAITAATGVIDKQAWLCQDISDNVSALESLREDPGNRVRICMGPRGIPSRVLARKFGGFGTFAALSDNMAGAPGQLSLAEMRDRLGWQRIDADTRVFGVLGWPVSHSLSPALFNWAFDRDGVNAVYLPLPAEDDGECVGFVDRCRRTAWLDMGGFSVTIPHKQAVCRAFAVGADEDVQLIGATNTVVLSDGRVSLANTDVRAIRAIVSELNRTGALSGSRALVVGAGGVGRAIVAALLGAGLEVTITNRTPERAGQLADEFGCSVQAWEERAVGDWDLLVNGTALGMVPATEGTPVPRERLKAGMVVFDTVYNPVRTRLLAEATDAGCRIVDGVEMFVRQAAEQYQLWTGHAMDMPAADSFVRDQLSRAAGLQGEASS